MHPRFGSPVVDGEPSDGAFCIKCHMPEQPYMVIDYRADHSLRVPLIFAGPGIPEGEQRVSPVYLLDIFPTLCHLTGTRIPESVEGKSLVPCINSPDADVRTSLYLAYANSIRGLTNGDHKLVEYACGQTQLFNLLKRISGLV